jgi:hypothetical protein
VVSVTEVVIDNDLMLMIEQELGDGSPDVSSTARYEYSHSLSPFILKFYNSPGRTFLHCSRVGRQLKSVMMESNILAELRKNYAKTLLTMIRVTW